MIFLKWKSYLAKKICWNFFSSKRHFEQKKKENNFFKLPKRFSKKLKFLSNSISIIKFDYSVCHNFSRYLDVKEIQGTHLLTYLQHWFKQINAMKPIKKRSWILNVFDKLRIKLRVQPISRNSIVFGGDSFQIYNFNLLDTDSTNSSNLLTILISSSLLSNFASHLDFLLLKSHRG